MAAFDLPSLARQQGVRRNVTLRPIVPTQAAATDLAAIISPAWLIWAESLDRILAAYDPKPLGDALVTDSPDAVQAILNAIGSEFLTRLVTEITPNLRRWTLRTERVHRGKWAAAVKAGTAADLATVLTAQSVEETLATFLNRNVELVSNISDQVRQRIADAVYRGYQARTPAREVAKEIREAADLGRKRALRIAADQNNKLSAALDMERQAEAGIEQYRWRHSGKLHPREEHKARDGKIYKLGDPSGDTPGMAPFCGCRAQAYLAIMDELG